MWWNIIKADYRDLTKLSVMSYRKVLRALLGEYSEGDLKKDLKDILKDIRNTSSSDSPNDSKILSHLLLQISLRPENFVPPVVNKIIERGGRLSVAWGFNRKYVLEEDTYMIENPWTNRNHLFFNYGNIHFYITDMSTLLAIEIMKQFKIKPESDISKASQKRRIDYDLFHNAVFSIIDTNEVILDSSIIHSIIEAYIKEVKNTGTHTYFINKFLKTTNMSSLQPVIQYISSVLRKAGYKSLGKGKYGRF